MNKCPGHQGPLFKTESIETAPPWMHKSVPTEGNSLGKDLACPGNPKEFSIVRMWVSKDSCGRS